MGVPDANAVRLVLELLGELHIGEPQGGLGLELFPLFGPQTEALDCLTVDEAMTERLVEIREVSEAGVVSKVFLHNRGRSPLLLIDADILEGAKQNRVLVSSVLVAGSSRMEVPVSCVERGRWSYRSRSFRSGPASSARLRMMKSVQVGQSLRSVGEHAADQSAIWDEVQQTRRRFGTDSRSEDLSEVYGQRRDEIEEFVRAVSSPEGARGVVVAIAGRPVCADIFASSALLRKLWSKLLRGYALDALAAEDSAKETRVSQVPAFLQSARSAKCRVHPSVGLGTDVRLLGPGITGSALVHEQAVLHLCLFALNWSVRQHSI